MIIYQSESKCWTANVKAQNIQTHINAADQFACEALALRMWLEMEDTGTATLLGHDPETGADIYEWAPPVCPTAADVLAILSTYAESDRWLCGDEVYSLEELRAQAATIAEEYALKTEEGDFRGTLSEYISSFLAA